jgi:hypothetical protein
MPTQYPTLQSTVASKAGADDPAESGTGKTTIPMQKEYVGQ